jgi:putative chitinase
MDRKRFYEIVRAPLFGGGIKQSAVDALGVAINEGQARGLPLRQLAYVMATMLHEVGRDLLPVRETFAATDAEARRKLARKKYGKPAGPFGHVYYGRGYVQLTWLDNYERQAKKIGADLVQFPDRVLLPSIAMRILFDGMVSGDFTGVKLSDFIKGDSADYFNARKIVNRLDKAQLIAGYAKKFETALRDAGYIGMAPKPKPEVLLPEKGGAEPNAAPPDVRPKPVADKASWQEVAPEAPDMTSGAVARPEPAVTGRAAFFNFIAKLFGAKQ